MVEEGKEEKEEQIYGKRQLNGNVQKILFLGKDKDMFKYIKRQWVLVLVIICIGIIDSIIAPVSAVLEKDLIDAIVQGNTKEFRAVLWFFVLMVLVTGAVYFARALTQSKFKNRFLVDIRNDLYDGIMRKGTADFQEKDTAEYISLIINDADTVVSNFSNPVWSLISQGFTVILSLTIMIIYSPVLAGTAVLCSAFSFLVPKIITKYLKKSLVETTVRRTALTVELKESFNGHDVVSAFGVLSGIHARFSEANKTLSAALYKFTVWVSMLENCSLVINKAVKVVTFLIAGGMAVRGQISVGTVLLFVSLYNFFSSGIMLFSQIVPLLVGCRPIIDRLMTVIDGADNVVKGSRTPTFSREIRVTDLSFRYKEEFPVLTDLKLTIQKGEKLALIGASGCGKSTFVKLLSGNYEGYQGEICYDGVELRQLDIEKLRKMTAVIHQKTFIFNNTIRYNICLGEQFTEAELSRALRFSGVEKFLPSITNGVDGECGEDGGNLSGGQKQRIALARALIRGVDFMILDEGVSAIDVETANEIEQELLNMKNLTLLTITHRIKDGLLECYDKVLYMDGGEIVEK